ncbi:MAG TPA: hypothetical protein PLL00_02075 [Bacteroidia bacterium]|jgi:hypothetical protein|nr:hypothetical protein [Bacteroidia bacterium]
MKKPNNNKKGPAKKAADKPKGKDAGELRKPAKLKPLKEKDKKNWKNNLDDDEDDFTLEEDDVKLNTNFDDDDDDDDDYYDDNF